MFHKKSILQPKTLSQEYGQAVEHNDEWQAVDSIVPSLVEFRLTSSFFFATLELSDKFGLVVSPTNHLTNYQTT